MKVAYITGGATGIGKATIEHFVRKGIKVGFLDSNEQAARQFHNLIDNNQVLFFRGDVRKVEDIKLSLNETAKHFGNVNIIFANAGIHKPHTIFDVNEKEWDLIINTNLKGTVFTVKESLPHLIKSGGGSIVLM